MALSLRHALSPLARCLSTAGRGFSAATLPDLSYDYGALQPAISGEIMELHHKKHHQAYVTNYNIAAEKVAAAEAAGDLATVIALQPAIKFNGGGHVNHSIFWTNLAPPAEAAASFDESSVLAKKIQEEFGGMEAFQTKFAAAAAGVQGSGWAWLGLDASKGRLAIAITANQDPCSTTGLVPLLGVDVWEHAYYLQYKNVRPDYLKAVWQVVNWKNVNERFEAAS